MRPSEVPRKHPNATLSGSLTAPAIALIWVLGHFGVSMTNEQAVAITGLIITVGLFVGRRGIKGLWRMLMEGIEDN